MLYLCVYVKGDVCNSASAHVSVPSCWGEITSLICSLPVLRRRTACHVSSLTDTLKLKECVGELGRGGEDCLFERLL